MLKKLLVVLSIIYYSTSFSQIIFENGYFVSNSNEKVICLIKNYDWKNTPTEFEYKLEESDNIKIGKIENVKEFGVNNESKYIRANVKIDKSSDNINFMSGEKNPIFNDEIVFLRVLLEGKANLYHYEEKSVERYLYSVDGKPISQLVYKRYQVDNISMSTNNQFRQQLFVDLKNDGISMNEFDNLNYTERDLLRFFKKYNSLNNSTSTQIKKPNRKSFFMTARAGIINSGLVVESQVLQPNYSDYGSKTIFRFGLEAELVFPFNKNKWSLILEPLITSSYKSKATANNQNVQGGIINSQVEFSSIQLAIGARHYLFLNTNSKLFLNASFSFDFSKGTTILFTRSNGNEFNSLNTDPQGFASFGGGFKYLNKFSVEARLHEQRIISNYVNWSTKYQNISLIFGYTFL